MFAYCVEVGEFDIKSVAFLPSLLFLRASPPLPTVADSPVLPNFLLSQEWNRNGTLLSRRKEGSNGEDPG